MNRDIYLQMFEVEEKHWWFVGRRLILKKLLDKYFQNKMADILEVGCGSGGNFGFLSSYGNMHAMEMDPEALAVANKRNVCSVKKGYLPEKIPFSKDFDLICMLDVLEHIEDDRSALRSVSKKLKRDGKILITVPAYRFLWSSHDITHHHKRRYTKSKLNQIIKEEGLKIKYFTYFNTFLFPVIVLVRALNNLLDKEGNTDMIMPSKRVNNLLKNIFSAETILIPRISLPFGVSLLIVAERN